MVAGARPSCLQGRGCVGKSQPHVDPNNQTHKPKVGLESPSPKCESLREKTHREEPVGSQNLLVLLPPPLYLLAMRSLAMVPFGGFSDRGTRAG